MRNYKNWEVTLLSRKLAVRVYMLLPLFPADERYALCQQLRRAAASIGANIAEGGGRETPRDIARFLSQSIGSVCEVEFLLQLSQDLNFITETTRHPVAKQLEDLKFKIHHLRKSILSE